MWRLYQTAKTWGQRPSRLTEIDDAWAALQLDNAVAYFGLVMENALQEMQNVGNDKEPKWQARYSLAELLTPGFVLGLGDDDGGDALPVGVDGMIYDEVG